MAPADASVVAGVAQTTVDFVMGEVGVEHVHGVSPRLLAGSCGCEASLARNAVPSRREDRQVHFGSIDNTAAWRVRTKFTEVAGAVARLLLADPRVPAVNARGHTD